ncbi:MAG: alanine-tRNA synthetase second additional domain-containing protein [Bacillota bacterium]|nr:alanine-tRNA synthetase second additional domain-containing protein [Bacillota bacterium]HHU62466.1 alanine-tRNA synthetase second additional domain-containing protein [Natronincola sp.]
MHYTTLVQAVYYAPRGKKRLMHLGMLVSQRYLGADDRLIGVVGDAGAGKSLLIRGMFPGLVLTNDDNGVNVRPLPVLEDARNNFFRMHTYHIDVRFEMAFTPLWELAEAVEKAISEGHRVVAEHFDLLYSLLNLNAEVLIGVGEEVVVTKPTIFGPFPSEVAKQAYDSLVYRKMAHSAEDLTSIIFEEMGSELPRFHSDVRRGFVVEFTREPDVDLYEVERRVLDYIREDLPICYYDDKSILIGEERLECSGPRIHMKSTGEIKQFRLEKEFQYSPISKTFLLAGRVG